MRPYLLHILDRAGRTALQVAAGYLVASATGSTADWSTIALTTALAVIVSVAQSVVDFPAIPGGWWADVTARALRTFAATTIGSIGASVLLTDVPWSTALTAATLAALSSVITSSVATPLGADSVKGTPGLAPVPIKGYTGYADPSRHLKQTPIHTTTAVATAVAAVLTFAGITTGGITAARDTHPTAAAAAAPTQPTPTPPPTVAPPGSPDRAPAYLTALQRNGIPTTNDRAALLLLAGSVCTQRATVPDAALTDQVVAVFPGRWNHAQAALIVDAAVDSYCD